MDKKPFWHKLSPDEQGRAWKDAVEQRLPLRQFADQYRQPSWCSYHDALIGFMGCWSLSPSMSLPSRITSKKSCMGCDLVKKHG